MSNTYIVISALHERIVNFGVHKFNDPQMNTDNWLAFQNKFSSEEDCVAFLYALKWPEGFHCPQCNHHKACVITSRRLPLYHCCNCRHQTSLTVGTIMEGSRTPLFKWLTAIFLTSRTENGINAAQLCKYISVTYKTAWSMLNLIRYSTSIEDSKQLLYGKIKGDLGISSQIPFASTLKLRSQEKPVFVGASLNERDQPIYVKMKLIALEDMKDSHLLKSGVLAFKEQHVEANNEDVTFVPRFSSKRVQSIKELFKQVMQRFKQTFRGLGHRHLQSYLDEACYRINLALKGINVFNHLSHLCISTTRKNKALKHINTNT